MDWKAVVAVELDSPGVRFPPPFIYLGALLLGLGGIASLACTFSAWTGGC